MRVLLTGGSGFLGRFVLDGLRKHGIDTVVVGRTLPRNVSPGDFIEMDLLAPSDLDDLVKSAGATHLLHLAWYAEHGKYWHSPLNLRWTEASVRLIEAFNLAGGRKVVVAGTCAEYDWSYGYCREDDTRLNPATLYGTAKDATRRLTAAICAEHKVQYAWGRIFLPYGKREDRRRLIPSVIDVFRGKRPPFGVNATAYRDFLHAEDVAEGFIKLLQSDTTGAYNICSGRPIEIAEIVRLIANALGANPDIVLELSSERPGEPPLLFGDNQKLHALGWRPKHQLAKLLSEVEQ